MRRGRVGWEAGTPAGRLGGIVAYWAAGGGTVVSS